MARQWRHLKVLKRSGRGHDPAGVAETKEGSCAVLCPACPDPERNLPVDWEEISKFKRFLYALFLAIDANFRSYSQELYFWKSSCSSHNAVNMADTKSSKGLAATGVGTVECARHNFKRPCRTGDLQVSEKYVNMDYMFFSTVRSTGLKVLKVSYDIACQWHKGLWGRMENLPEGFQLDHEAMDVTFLVPKFHLPAHITACQIYRIVPVVSPLSYSECGIG
ncbi:hypothetical protein HYDPIDRAFT_103222 [Hydnomerulius pinastri MD-312]|uniref:CxC2-like cysteine cluster KDZ transposase-associated domain-containing protein n=1 Tax=Hydnomerulius pinastri MD-312 TaxID=994086 RepID=A0A0C9UYQ8_9AGAM|nr:hypothetical protein HYDPIDRAFT_103222 [Hydnomerulius pinastri MD-312]